MRIGVSLVFASCLLSGLAATSFSYAADPQPGPVPRYKITNTIPLGAPDRWDLLQFEPAAHRVYIAHGTEITVIDADKATIIGHVAGLDKAHGVVAVPEIGRGYADSGATGSILVFDLKTLQPVKTLQGRPDADAMAYDPVTKHILVMNGDDDSATVIDTASDSVIATIPLGGGPEFAVADGHGAVYANIESTSEIVRIDTASNTVAARWPIPDCEAPHGLAIDPLARFLFASCVNSRMLAIDTKDGKVLATLPIGKGTDAAAFDPIRHLVFSSNGEGTLSVIAVRDPGSFVALGDVTTLPGARTMALDHATGRIFLVTGEVAGEDPPTKPGRPPHFKFTPGSAKLLILEPGP